MHDVNKLCARMSLTEIFTSSFDQLDEMIVANLKVGKVPKWHECTHALFRRYHCRVVQIRSCNTYEAVSTWGTTRPQLQTA